MSRSARSPGARLAAAGLAASSSAGGRVRERVHAARVASKRLRSFWRVLAVAAGASRSRRRRRELSRAARFLAAARELDALRELARKLARSEPALEKPLSSFLRRLPPAPAPASVERNLARAAAALEASSRALAGAALSARRSDVRAGLAKLERKLDRLSRRARRRGRPADLHACRKRAKDLRHVLEALGARRRDARVLRKAGDELGAARDLRLLASRAGLRGGRLEKAARKLDASALERLEALRTRRRHESDNKS